ncbi:MAG: hypothetical protein K2X08_05815 [Chlamydiales bacterium]|nr:hypothetical protein [Chlamydiales bacterium]
MNESLPDEFLEVLTAATDSLRQRLFAIDLNQGSKKDAYKSMDFLVDALGLLEQHADKSTVRDPTNLESYFLKCVLERNAPLFYQEQNVFGFLRIARDRSLLTIPEQNRISVQVAAQILWYEEGDSYPTITSLVKALRSKSNPLHGLLKLERFHDAQTLKKWVSPMFPIPTEDRKKHWDRKVVSSKVLMSIPGVASEAGINFAKLRYAAQQIARILQSRGWTLSKVLFPPYIQALEALLPQILRMYVREWATEPID